MKRSGHSKQTHPNQTAEVILFVHYGEDWIRGSERCLLDLLTHIDRRRFNPVVWCNSKVLAEAVEDLDVQAVVSDFPLLFGWQRPRFALIEFFGLIKKGIEIVNRHEVRLIHANSGAPNQWLNAVVRTCGIPLVTQLHSRYPLRDRITLGLHHVTMAIGVSQPVIEQLLADGMPVERTRVIANGIDTERLTKQTPVDLRQRLKLPQDCFLLATVASLIPRKGVDLLIDAVAQLIEQAVPARLAVIGDGPEQLRLRQQIQSLHLEKHVFLLGEQSNVFGLIQNVDLFVSGAREEVFGLVLAEAGLAALPVVAPAVGGIPSVVADGISGKLVPPDDSKALADAIADLYRSPEYRRQMGERGRRHVMKHFTIEKNVQQFEQLYQCTLDDPGSHMHWLSHWQWWPAFFNVSRRLLKLTGKKMRLGEVL